MPLKASIIVQPIVYAGSQNSGPGSRSTRFQHGKGSWSFQGRIPKQELGNERKVMALSDAFLLREMTGEEGGPSGFPTQNRLFFILVYPAWRPMASVFDTVTAGQIQENFGLDHRSAPFHPTASFPHRARER